MTREKIILTDCDGVLVNWNKGFDIFMLSKGWPRLPDSADKYSIQGSHGTSVETGDMLVGDFNKSDAIASLSPFADAVEGVRELSELGFKFIAVTSISDHPTAYANRTKNLADIFGDVFLEVNCITMGASKANILKRWAGTGYFWIEDHMRQAEAGHEVGLKTVLIDHPYNAHYSTDLFPRVGHDTPWAEIIKLVRNDYQI